MGLRLHKAVGYGLTDVGSMHGNLVDDRFSRREFLDRSDKLRELTFGAFADWFDNNYDRVKINARSEFPQLSDDRYDVTARQLLINFHESAATHVDDPSKTLGDRVCMQLGDPGIDRVVLFLPPITAEPWLRTDDLFDFLEDDLETHGAGCVARVRHLKTAGVPPNDRWLIRFREADGRLAPGIKALNSIEPDLVAHLRNTTTDPTQRLLVENDFQFNWRPPVPFPLVALLTFLEPGIVQTQTVVDDLRPLMVTYWK